MEQEALTLEKLKVNERLGNLEVSVTKILTHTEVNQSKQQETLDGIRKILEKHDDIILGTNGLSLKVDRLEIEASARRWHIRTVWVVLSGVIVNLIIKYFHG